METMIAQKLSYIELRNMKSLMLPHECVRMFMHSITEWIPEGDPTHPSRSMRDTALYMKRVLRLVYEAPLTFEDEPENLLSNFVQVA